jgi:MT-A70
VSTISLHTANLTPSSNEIVRKVQILLENSNPRQLDRLRTGQVSISHVFTNYKQSQDHRNTPKLPQGEFDVLVADLPYRYEINLRDSAEYDYSTMDYREIAEIKVPSADNSILFLWATQPLIKEALYVMEKWEFNYKSGAVWVKNRIGNGYYFRFRHELILIGVKGKMLIPEENDRPDSVIQAEKTIHSGKT